MSLTIFFYLSLAAWRLASLIANEDGPWMIFKRIRQRAEQWCQKYRFCNELGLYELFSCEWWNTIWIGAGLTLFYIWMGESIFFIALPFALSTVVILIKYVLEFLQRAHPMVDSNSI